MKQLYKIDSEKAKEYMLLQLQALSLEPVKIVEVKPYQKNRTAAQNRLMHKWFSFIDEWVFESTGKASGTKKWKWYFKDLYLGYETVELFNGRVIEQLKSTADLSTKELTEFLEKIDAHCVNEFGLVLPHPDDIYYEAMGIKR